MDELHLIDEVETWLRKKLESTNCVICGSSVVALGGRGWNYNHSPYIEVSGDEIVAGYRCREDPDNPVIVFRISRSRSDRGRTRVYE
jgi:hypothetical protein